MTPDFQSEKAQLIMTLRGMGIMDPAALAALEKVPRELFVPAALRHHSMKRILAEAYEQTITSLMSLQE